MEVIPPDLPSFRLITLGRIALETPAGEDADLARRRRKLALLAVLALSTEPPSRESLAAMFWGDEDPERARHSLSDALSSLRRVLGRDAIAGRSELVQLNTGGQLRVDAIEMEQAFESGDYARATALYHGPFLDTLAVAGSVSFAQWATAMRERFAALFARAEAARLASAVALPPRMVPPRRRTRTLLLGAAAGATVAAAVVAGLVVAQSSREPSSKVGGTPIVALMDVRTEPADTSLAWLRVGLEQMIAADLGRVTTVGVVPPSSVREVMPTRTNEALPAAESIALARRLHADWAASADVSRRDGRYVVAITLRSVGGAVATRTYVVSGADILTVADEAAAKMLSTLDVGGSGPRLSNVETASTDAYRHFIRSEELEGEGKETDAARELDAAIAVDSGFTSAIIARSHMGLGDARARLRPLLDRARARMTDWDRLSEAIFETNSSGEPVRAELLGRQLVSRYPRDPRALRSLADIYALHAAYAPAESMYLRLIVLDRSAAQSVGPCWACDAYAGLTAVRHLRGDHTGEIDAARRWTELRPASAAAWLSLANALVLNGGLPASEAAYARYRQLVGEARFDPFTGRMLITSRRLDEAEAYARRFLESASSDDAYDLLQTVMRERGQFKRAVEMVDAAPATASQALSLVQGHTLGALGVESRARALFEKNVWHPSNLPTSAAQYGNDARGFTWHHELEADALRARMDTASLRAIADSVQRIGRWSYYARDWTAFHHVRGLIAERGGRLEEARSELTQALSLVRGFTRTNVELARVEIALGAPQRAIRVMREAYHEPIDAMGRYAPRSEMDFEMARAFAHAGQADSARVYASYVRAAWVHADPEFQRRLAELP
jgi:tetratricopeptide (TPR) repeat protein